MTSLVTKPWFAVALGTLFASPAIAAKSQPAMPLANPADWISTEDYPDSSLRRNSEGITSFELKVGTDGRVRNCTITVSSGWAVLDETTCRLITERARFSPATDRRGRPVEGSYSNRVRWVIPEDRRLPQDGLMVSSILVAPDGEISDCRIERVVGGARQLGSVGPMPRCPKDSFPQGYTDKDGNPVAKRVRTIVRIEVLDPEGPDSNGSPKPQ